MPPALLLNPSEVRTLSAEFESASPTEILHWAFDEFGTRAAIGTSFQGAGLVTIHHAIVAGIAVPVFTIDTGLLFAETLELKRRLEKFFGITIESLVSELTVEEQSRKIAPELWKVNPDLCCTITFPPEALNPKRSIPTTLPSRPTKRDQKVVTPASMATRFRQESGSTSSW